MPLLSARPAVVTLADLGDCSKEPLNAFVVVAVVQSGVPGRVGVSRHLRQRDGAAAPRRLPHGAQPADPDGRQRRVGQRAERHAVRIRRRAARRAIPPAAQRAPRALGLARQRVRRRRPSAGACFHLLVHRTQNCRLGGRLTWCGLTLVLEYSLVVVATASPDKPRIQLFADRYACL